MKLLALFGAYALSAVSVVAQVAVDVSKITYTVGQGEKFLPVTVHFNEGVLYSSEMRQHLDHIVWGYRYDGERPSVATVISAIAEADTRVVAEVDGSEIKSLGFDIDGDGVIATPKDNLCASTEEKAWHSTISDEGLTLSYGEEAPVTLPYVFYVPEPGKGGVYVPAEVYLRISDTEKYIPYMLQKHEGREEARFSSPSWTAYADEELTQVDRTIVSGVSSQANYTSGLVTYVGNKTGDVYYKITAMTYNPYREDFEAQCLVHVAAPEVPVSSISFPEKELSLGLNKRYDGNAFVIEPANATFTKVVVQTDNSKVASINATTGLISTTKEAGEALLTVSYAGDDAVSASCRVTTSLQRPVEDFSIIGLDEDATEIVLYPKRLLGLRAQVVPADADIPEVNVELVIPEGVEKDGAGRPLNAEGMPVMSMYKVNYWDENNTRVQFQELSGHYPGEGCGKVVISTTDGSNITKEFPVRVVDPDRTPMEDGYVDGTIIMNEEWFGHTNGGMNYLTPEGEMVYQAYERENPYQSFGCTSQFGTIWAGKLLVSSKQDKNRGDVLPGGGRLVVADAKTLKRVGSIDDIMYGDETKSADGRAIAGATPSKIYHGTSNGIYVVDLDEIKVTGKISIGEEDGNLYSGQIGDMLNAGRYVFGIKQAEGVFVIDTETDCVVHSITEPGIQGITQTADGNVWYAATIDGQSNFVAINPVTFEEVKRAVLPANFGSVSCSWGAWRHTPFFASNKSNVIYFLTGAGGIAGGGAAFYRWDTDSSIDELKPFFEVADMQGSNARTKQTFYASHGYDSRNDRLYVFTVDGGASGHYRFAWTHIVDGTSGELVKTIELEPYYWFQSMIIVPDKHCAEVDLNEVELSTQSEEATFDLAELVTDADGLNANILTSLDVENLDTDVAAVVLDGKTLKVSPVASGETEFGIRMSSNGVVATHTVKVKVNVVAESVTLDQTSIEDVEGVSVQLAATVLPENTTDKTIVWTSSDETVATVDDHGLVTLVKPGSAVITVTCGDVSADCAVTVNTPVYPAESVTLDQTSIEDVEGVSVQLTAIVLPENTTDKTIVWASSDETVATVDDHGLVSLVKSGSAVITVTCGDVSADCTVKVYMIDNLNEAEADMRTIIVERKRIRVVGYDGETLRIFTTNGVQMLVREIVGNDCVTDFNLPVGVYVIRVANDTMKISVQ